MTTRPFADLADSATSFDAEAEFEKVIDGSSQLWRRVWCDNCQAVQLLRIHVMGAATDLACDHCFNVIATLHGEPK